MLIVVNGNYYGSGTYVFFRILKNLSRIGMGIMKILKKIKKNFWDDESGIG